MSRRDEAIRAFCKLRRLQEASDSGYVHCITCGKVVRWNECDGGHFIPRRYRGTEINPDNVWPQCVTCNRYGTITRREFAEKVAERVGWKKVKSLDAQKSLYIRRDYSELIRSFRSQIAKLRREKGL